MRIVKEQKVIFDYREKNMQKKKADNSKLRSKVSEINASVLIFNEMEQY